MHIIGSPFHKALRYRYLVYGQSYRANYWGEGSTGDGSLCMGIPYSVSTPSSVLSCLNFSERTHYERLFDPPIHDHIGWRESSGHMTTTCFLRLHFTLTRISKSSPMLVGWITIFICYSLAINHVRQHTVQGVAGMALTR
eukprot:3254609-Pleurochrysis_carterae.AAC.1